MWWINRCLIAFSILAAHDVGCKKLSTTEAQLARSYGYPEKQIEKWKSGHVTPPAGCSEMIHGDDFFCRYRTYDEIEEFLTQRLCMLRKEVGSRGSLCKVKVIGYSLEKRPIYAIEIRNKENLRREKQEYDNEGQSSLKFKIRRQKILLVTATVHAREWTTTTSALYTAIHVDVTDVSIFMIPLVNPDGYVYTWTGLKQIKSKWTKGGVEEVLVEARYFRKNRRKNYDGTYGVDLNRNFGSSSKIWGTDKKSKSINLTGSDIYQGIAGFSEPETRAVKDYFQKYQHNIVGLLDIHCCLPALLEPFSHKKNPLPQYVKDVGKVILDAINSKAPRDELYEWKPRPVSSASGSGLSSAWANEEAKIPFTFVLEIRGKFVMICSAIESLGSEVLLGTTSFLQQLSRMEEIMINRTTSASASNHSSGFVEFSFVFLSISLGIGFVAMIYRRKPKKKA